MGFPGGAGSVLPAFEQQPSLAKVLRGERGKGGKGGLIWNSGTQEKPEQSSHAKTQRCQGGDGGKGGGRRDEG